MPLYGEPLPGPVKVAVVADPGGHGVHPTVRGAVAAAADALRDAGYDVREMADVPRLDEALEAYGRIIVTEFAPTWPAVRKLLGEGGDRYIQMAMEKTPPANAAELMKLMGTWLGIRRSWAEFLDEFPLLLGPVFTEPPVEPGLESRDEAGRERVGSSMRLCTVTSFVGVPAVAVPTGVRRRTAVRRTDHRARVPGRPVPGRCPGDRGPPRRAHADRPSPRSPGCRAIGVATTAGKETARGRRAARRRQHPRRAARGPLPGRSVGKRPSADTHTRDHEPAGGHCRQLASEINVGERSSE